ncbi:UpxY family transcription antiterminator [Aquimarina sediminis]|uniref:UpxY family transcription antiterminator n=1 Tax=Aquimarina sediminis TaxID=2070536 RepID=UPI000CA044AA|nr:UpxY family transcription antiterminator [Aquimarina sediminis]
MRGYVKTGWYVLYVKSCQEKRVQNLLEENNLEAFVPTIKTIRQWSDRKKVVHKPLFTSYVFVNINSSSDFYRALNVDGACTFIRFGNEYGTLTDEEIYNLKKLSNLRGIQDIIVKPESSEISEVIKTSYSILKEFKCQILKVNDIKKVVVKINSLQQRIIVTAPMNCILDLEDGKQLNIDERRLVS